MQISNKEITIWKYTRWIDRDYNIILLDWIPKMPKFDFNLDWSVKETLDIDPKFASNIQKANDFLVSKMTWLSQTEIDDLSIKDFENIIIEINKVKNTTPTVA